jgi:hypothetical protein
MLRLCFPATRSSSSTAEARIERPKRLPHGRRCSTPERPGERRSTMGRGSHADTILPPNTFEEIARTLRDARVVGGAFRFSFDTRCAIARAIASWVNFRSHVFNFFLGDQALFVRKDVFLRAGGFRDWNLMEDVEILGRLRRFGRLRLTRATIATSARRHLRNGWLRTTGTVWLVTWLYFFGVPARILTTFYRRTRTTYRQTRTTT